MSKLPDTIVQDLNAAGLGGRLIYVPLRKKTISDEICQTMISRLEAGKDIDLDEFQNMVSMRTLYRLKAKAIGEFACLKEKGQGNESEQRKGGG